MRFRMSITRRRTIALLVPVALLALAALVAAPTLADEGVTFRAQLSGFSEVPAISTTGSGEFRARLMGTATAPFIEYELSYSGLVGGPSTLFAHIHLGQAGVNGGVIAFLCGGGGKPACTFPSGTFTGTIVPADVIGPIGQGILAGEFAEAVDGLQAGVVYANVHTSVFPGGEIRGQIK